MIAACIDGEILAEGAYWRSRGSNQLMTRASCQRVFTTDQFPKNLLAVNLVFLQLGMLLTSG